MRKILTLMAIATVFIFTIPPAHSFTPEKGFYAEYRLWENPKLPETTAFALLKEHQEWEVKYFFIRDLVYKYQILEIKNNIATIRICFEGTALGYGHRVTGQMEVPFRRIFDIKLDLDTLEMVDENGNAWGKWLFWVKLGSYDLKEYTVMKNWNNHGSVGGWIYGPYENDFLFEVLNSPYLKDTAHFFQISTLKTVSQKHEVIYPSFEEYGIVASYKDYKTSGGIHSGGWGGYYLDEVGIVFGDGERKAYPPGLNTMIFYNEDGLLLESREFYMDDFIDQKLGIVVLQLNSLTLTNCGVKNKTMIGEPTPENQRTSFEKEVEMMVGKNEPEETPSKTENPPETTESPQEKSETPLPTTRQSQEGTENNTTLYYVAPLLVVAFIAVFLVLKEKR